MKVKIELKTTWNGLHVVRYLPDGDTFYYWDENFYFLKNAIKRATLISKMTYQEYKIFSGLDPKVILFENGKEIK